VNEATMRARTTSEIVDAVFVLYRRDAGQLLVLSAIAILPTLLVQLIFPTPTAQNLTELGGVVWVMLIVGPLCSYMIGATFLVDAASTSYLGETVDAAQIVRRSSGRMLRVLGAAISLYLLYIVTMAVVVGIGTAIVLTNTSNGPLRVVFIAIAGLGGMAGGGYFVARFFAITPAIVVERLDIGAALSRSSALARDRKWHVLLTLGLAMLIVLVATLGAGAAAVILPGTALQLVATSIITLVAKPILHLTVTVLYYDARIRGEGFDLDHLAQALDAGVAPAGQGIL
jgi:hypothetical protein